MRRVLRSLLPALLAFGLLAASAGAGHVPAKQQNMDIQFSSQNSTNAINSDLAFWGDRAYAGNYNGFRIFDISDPASPQLLVDFPCFGPQNDLSVWDNRILVLSVDSVLTDDACGSPTSPTPEASTNWEGLRIFDVSNPAAPVHIASVYQDCGSHTHTMVPDLERNRVLIYNASYSLRPGPTCGPVTGPANGRAPDHGVIQVVEIPLDDPAAAAEIAEPEINYPGDSDNVFNPAHHGLDVPGVFFPLRACHDIAVYLPERLVAGACAEQAQLWRMDENGIPDTANPLWVFDNPSDENGATGDPADQHTAVDFWHSATFTWDGKIVNFSDESFGDGCPAVTNITDPDADNPGASDTGRTYFLNTKSGKLLSLFQIPRREPGAYCSTHQGNVIGTPGRNLLVQAWYMGGVDIIDFTAVKNPREVAFFDLLPDGPTGSDNWAHYWYEQDPVRGRSPIVTYGTDGVHNPSTGRGFEVFQAFVQGVNRSGLDHLNPQTQEVRLP